MATTRSLPVRAFLRAAALLGSLFSLASCRLYDPPRYSRLQFPPDAPATRVLMIGNSLTYYNDLPGLLQQFSAREATPIYIESITTPFASLQFHWNLGVAPARIRDKHWDYVILQDFSRRPVTDPQNSLNDFTRFADLAHANGAKVIIFENWPREGHDSDAAALAQSYQNILAKTAGIPAPIGDAFEHCHTTRPDIALLLDDRHPSDAATYLAAAVLYDTIYQKKSAALPMDLQGPKLPPSQKEALRAFADQARPPGRP